MAKANAMTMLTTKTLRQKEETPLIACAEEGNFDRVVDGQIRGQERGDEQLKQRQGLGRLKLRQQARRSKTQLCWRNS